MQAIKDVIPNAQKATQVILTSSTTLKKYIDKKETRPPFIKGEFLALYNTSELPFIYVFGEIKKLGAKTMIDIGNSTINVWYEEMLKLNWSLAEFKKRVEAVGKAELYGRIDWNIWLKAEQTIYSETEITSLLNRRIEQMIAVGNRCLDLLNKGFSITEEELKLVKLASAQRFQSQLQRARSEFIEEQIEAHTNELRIKRQARVKDLKELPREFRVSLIDLCFNNGVFPESEKFLRESYADNLHIIYELIPEYLIKDIQGYISNKQTHIQERSAI